MSKQSPAGAAATACLCVIALLLAIGCATTQHKEDEELRLKQASSHFNLGVDYARKGRLALAIRELLAAEKLDPQNSRTQLTLADAYSMRNKPAEAEKHYLRTLELDPTLHEARLHLSSLYNQLGRYAESLPHASMLVDDATFPGPWRALVNKAVAEYRLGRREAARESLQLGLEYRGDYWPTLFYLGVFDMEEGRRVEALGFFRQALEQEPDLAAQAEINYRIGEIYVALGKRKQAISHLQAAVAQTPGGPWGVKSEEYLKLLR